MSAVGNSRFFIVGSSRSGTTMLRLMLAGHSRLSIPPETWFLLTLVKCFPLSGPLSAAEARAAIAAILTCHRWPDMAIDATDFERRAAALDRPSLRDLADIVYAVHCDRAGKPRAGDKTPTYIGIVPQLKRLYPDAKFINMIRDGRDVTISFVDAHFKGRPYHGRKFEWTNAVRLAADYRKSSLAAEILDVRYENLIAEPERALRVICAFLGEQFEPAMLAFQSRTALVPERERGIQTKLNWPIRPDLAGAWRGKLSTLESFLIEASLRHDLAALDYPLRYRAAAWRPLQVAIRVGMRACAPFLDRAIPALRRRDIIARNGYL
jgi:Sulfotransferase family